MMKIKDFNRINVLVIGDLILDKYIKGTVERISPEAPVPIVKLHTEHFFPGGAANVTCNIKSLGGNPILVGVRGYSHEDSAGVELINLLAQENISNQFITTMEHWKTPVKTRVIVQNQQIIRLDNEIENLLLNYSKLIENIEFILKNRKIHSAIISDYTKNTLDSNIIKKIIQMLKKKKIPIIVDSKRQDWSVFAGATIITPNSNELKNAMMYAHKKEINDFLNDLDIKYVLITMGENGMSLYEKQLVKHFETKAKQVYDVTGAGDTVVATLALGLGTQKMNLFDCITLANIVAGIAVEKLGTSIVTIKEVKERIKFL